MKLPIKKKFYDRIEKGNKQLEFRDAHLTFVCEETHREMTFDISSVSIQYKVKLIDDLHVETDEIPFLNDDKIIVFSLGRRLK